MTLRIRDLATYENAYQKSVENPEGFWAEQASSFSWRKKWEKVLQWDFRGPDVKWFIGGKLNITENCLDRHLESRGDKVAILWEPNEPGEPAKTYTYKELHAEVCRMANLLKSKGIQKGDRICFYMPMVPELAISVLACARIGAIHSVVFAGFSANALADRINDASCKMVICSDGNFRGKKRIPVKAVVDEALQHTSTIETVLVLQRTGDDVAWEAGRDVWIHEAIESMSDQCEAEEMDAEDTLFILYTSGFHRKT